jgi:hypothetical protein
MNDPAKVPNQAQGQSARGFSYQLFGWILMFTSAIWAVAKLNEKGTFGDFLIVVGCFAAAGFFLLRGRRYSTQIFSEPPAGKAPIVYLRSFADENKDHGALGTIKGAFQSKQIALEIPAAASTEQFLLEQFFSNIGPYLTIGKPGELIAQTGAARIYKNENEWKPFVVDLLRRAQLVVVRAGASQGLRWEVGKMLSLVPPCRVLVILSGRGKDYQAFVSWANSIFHRAFPSKEPDTRLMTFQSDWSPVPLPIKPALRDTLAPFLAANGIAVPEWKPSYRPKWRSAHTG